MVQKIKEQISVSIKGRVFDLVCETDHGGLHACDQCALLGEVCKGTIQSSLLALCSTIVEEPETWFVESTSKFQVHGINEKEILITALTEYKKEMIKIGNSERALKVLKMIDRI